MTKYFVTDGLTINLSRSTEDQIKLYIGSDFAFSTRKSQLWMPEKEISSEMESLWKKIRTRKLLNMSVHFDEIDYYDNLTNIYDTPIVTMEKGKRKPRISYQQHGSIPKDWGISFNARFEDTRTKTPIMEVIKAVLGYKFTPEIEKKFTKVMTPFLQKKEKYCSIYNDND